MLTLMTSISLSWYGKEASYKNNIPMTILKLGNIFLTT